MNLNLPDAFLHQLLEVPVQLATTCQVPEGALRNLWDHDGGSDRRLSNFSCRLTCTHLDRSLPSDCKRGTPPSPASSWSVRPDCRRLRCRSSLTRGLSEWCCGLYFPSIGIVKSKYVPEEVSYLEEQRDGEDGQRHRKRRRGGSETSEVEERATRDRKVRGVSVEVKDGREESSDGEGEGSGGRGLRKGWPLAMTVDETWLASLTLGSGPGDYLQHLSHPPQRNRSRCPRQPWQVCP